MASPRPARRAVIYGVGAMLAVFLVGALLWYVRSIIASKPKTDKRQVQQVVKIIRPPETPPPPPPPPEEKPPEPVPQDIPEDKPIEQAPESAQLGVDAEGAAGADGFGLAARPGGRDLVGSGTGAFVWYTSQLKDLVQEALSANDRVRGGKYTVVVRLWVASDGHIERVALSQSTGARDLDSAIEQALTRVGRMRESPPLEMPQPVTLKIVSRS